MSYETSKDYILASYEAIEDIVHFVNMQNIPSHATDIRHMFRATAEQEYVLDKTIEDNESTIEFVIDNGHQVNTPDGLMFVTDLKQGDSVIFEEEGKEKVLNVKEVTIEGASTRICYDVI